MNDVPLDYAGCEALAKVESDPSCISSFGLRTEANHSSTSHALTSGHPLDSTKLEVKIKCEPNDPDDIGHESEVSLKVDLPDSGANEVQLRAGRGDLPPEVLECNKRHDANLREYVMDDGPLESTACEALMNVEAVFSSTSDVALGTDDVSARDVLMENPLDSAECEPQIKCEPVDSEDFVADVLVARSASTSLLEDALASEVSMKDDLANTGTCEVLIRTGPADPPDSAACMAVLKVEVESSSTSDVALGTGPQDLSVKDVLMKDRLLVRELLIKCEPDDNKYFVTNDPVEPSEAVGTEAHHASDSVVFIKEEPNEYYFADETDLGDEETQDCWEESTSGAEVSKKGQFQCVECNFAAFKSYPLLRHIRAKHNKEKVYSCSFCDYRALYSSTLTKHIKAKHVQMKPYSCSECDFSTAEKTKWNRHVFSPKHKLKNKLPCNKCEFAATSNLMLKKHLKTKHAIIDESEQYKNIKVEPFCCHLCKYSTYLKGDLKTHIRGHNVPGVKEKKYPCQLCDFSATNEDGLSWHVRAKHTQEKPFACPECPYSAAHSSTLSKHFKSKHTNARPYSCDLCSYATFEITKLRRHNVNRHTLDKPYSCDYCDYKAGQSDTLKTHVMAKHLNVRPFSCAFCEYFAVSNSTLTKHVMRKHTMEKRFPCASCDYFGVTKNDVARHTAAVHENIRPFSCEYCGFSTYTTSLLKTHIMWKHTEVRPHSCKHCEYSTVTGSALRRHIRRRHEKS